jgi:hypothetical protein
MRNLRCALTTAIISAFLLTAAPQSANALDDEGVDFPIVDRERLPAFSCDDLWDAPEPILYYHEGPSSAECVSQSFDYTYGWAFIPDNQVSNLIPWELEVDWSDSWSDDDTPDTLTEEIRGIFQNLVRSGDFSVRQERFGPYYAWSGTFEYSVAPDPSYDWGITFYRSAVLYGPYDAVLSMLTVLPERIEDLDRRFLVEGRSYGGLRSLESIKENALREKPAPFSCEDVVDPSILEQGFILEEDDEFGSALGLFCALHSPDDEYLSWYFGFSRRDAECWDPRAAIAWRGNPEDFEIVNTAAGDFYVSVGALNDPRNDLFAPRLNGQPIVTGSLDDLDLCVRFDGWPEAIITMRQILKGEEPAPSDNTPPTEATTGEATGLPSTVEFLPPAGLLAITPPTLQGPTSLWAVLYGVVITVTVGAGWWVMSRRRRLLAASDSDDGSPETSAKPTNNARTAILLTAAVGLVTLIAAAVSTTTTATQQAFSRISGDTLASGVTVWAVAIVVAVFVVGLLGLANGYRMSSPTVASLLPWLVVVIIAPLASLAGVLAAPWIPAVALLGGLIAATSIARPGVAAASVLWGTTAIGLASFAAISLLPQVGAASQWVSAVLVAIGLIAIGSSALMAIPIKGGPGATLCGEQLVIWAITSSVVWGVWAMVFVHMASPLAWLVVVSVGLLGLVVTLWSGRSQNTHSVESQARGLDTVGAPSGH